MTLYQSRPTTVEAVQWTGENGAECFGFCKPKVRIAFGEVELLAGKDGAQEWVPVPIGHWLVCQPDDKSDIWPVDPDYFAAKYEPVVGDGLD
jgi:hypothetical protein